MIKFHSSAVFSRQVVGIGSNVVAGDDEDGHRVFSLPPRNVDAVANVFGSDESEAALCCAGMPRKHYLAGRVKWGQDWSCMTELERLLWASAVDLSVREHWKIYGKQGEGYERGRAILRSLAGLAIAETADPGNWKDDEKRLRWTGFSLHEWYRWPKWAERYQAVYQILDNWADEAARHAGLSQRG